MRTKKPRRDRRLFRHKAKRRATIGTTYSAMISIQGMIQIGRIRSTIGLTPQEKALAIAQITIDTAIAISKAFNSVV